MFLRFWGRRAHFQCYVSISEHWERTNDLKRPVCNIFHISSLRKITYSNIECWMRGKPLLQAYHDGLHDKVILSCWPGIIHSLPKQYIHGEAKADLVSSAFVCRGHECHFNIAFWPDWEQTTIRISKGAHRVYFRWNWRLLKWCTRQIHPQRCSKKKN